MKLYIKSFPADRHGTSPVIDFRDLNVDVVAEQYELEGQDPPIPLLSFSKRYDPNKLVHDVNIAATVTNGEAPGAKLINYFRRGNGRIPQASDHVAIALRWGCVDQFVNADHRPGRKGILIKLQAAVAILASPPDSESDWRPFDLESTTSWSTVFDMLDAPWPHVETPEQYLANKPLLKPVTDAVKKAAALKAFADAVLQLEEQGVAVTRGLLYSAPDFSERISVKVQLEDLALCGSAIKDFRSIPHDNANTFPGANDPRNV